jgi:hypothetical protein
MSTSDQSPRSDRIQAECQDDPEPTPANKMNSVVWGNRELNFIPAPDELTEEIKLPKYAIGDRVSWHPLPSRDFGIITGLEYAPAEHLQAWGWRYIVWLDPDSPSHSCTRTDIAWEEDLLLQSPESASTAIEVNQQ